MDLYYPSPRSSAPPFIVTLRASIVSAMPKQQRFLIKGTKGSYVKYGVDPQERQTAEMRRLGRKADGYGMDEESEWGELSLAKEEREGTEWDESRYVLSRLALEGFDVSPRSRMCMCKQYHERYLYG